MPPESPDRSPADRSTAAGPASESASGSAAAPEPADELPLLTLRDGLTEVVDTPTLLERTVAALRAGTGPIAIDAERASGYRYSARAYLIQLRREGSGTHLIDPIGIDDFGELAEVLVHDEWILHAAGQDLPCLRELGLEPSSLFDTELAARLLGYPRVGLASLVESLTGQRMRKEHSAADWSKRPLPVSWLDYAALDVEALIEIRELLTAELADQGKTAWARQEFEHVMTMRPVPRVDPWRRTSGIQKARGRRTIATVRELWLARDAIAGHRDMTPSKILPDSAIVAAANAAPKDRNGLLTLAGFHGRGAARYASTWLKAIRTAHELPDGELPPTSLRSDGPPPPRAWADRNPEAAARLTAARAALASLSEEQRVPVENLLTPDLVRRVLWSPPTGGDAATLTRQVGATLTGYGARPWQIETVGPLLVEAILHPADLSPSGSDSGSE